MEHKGRIMVYRPSAPSGTSLVLGRWGRAATTPSGEQQLLQRLRAAASDAGCRAPDVVTSVYVGLKLGLRLCVYGSAPGGTQALVEALAATVVGADSEQVLRLHGPVAEGMARRYAAVRLNEFVAAAVDPLAQGKAWFVVADTPGEAGVMGRWLDHELCTALCSAGARAAPNMFVLLAAGEVPACVERGWLCVPLRRFKQAPVRRVAAVPPVGYQRHLLDNRLTGPVYRRLLRSEPRRRIRRTRRDSLFMRWLAASRDAQGRGLWRSAPDTNTRRALLALRRCRRPD